MIPKIIHYCWFGQKEKPKEVKEYISKWRKKLPDYRIVEWNENNFDIHLLKYSEEAYKKGKYAFVSDIARLYALCEMGGVYLDTDIEIKRDFSELLKNHKLILGYENSGKQIMTAFIGSEKNNAVIRELLSSYKDESFIKKDGGINDYPNTYRLTELLKSKGIRIDGKFQQVNEDIVIYPEKFFSAMTFSTMTEISDESTYTVHHFKSSWKPWYVRLRRKVKIFLFNSLRLNKIIK